MHPEEPSPSGKLVQHELSSPTTSKRVQALQLNIAKRARVCVYIYIYGGDFAAQAVTSAASGEPPSGFGAKQGCIEGQ